MSFGSFLQGVLAQVNPWDHGATYGTYNPPKKKLPDTPGYQQPSLFTNRAPGLTPPDQQPSSQPPVNIFDSLNKGLTLGSSQPGVVPVFKTADTQPAPTPQPGTVVQPQKVTKNGETGTMVTSKVNGQPVFVPDAPVVKKPSFWGSVGNALKTAGQTAVGTVANVPEVGLAAGRAATGIVQGALDVPHIATAIPATITQQLQEHMNNPVTRQVNRGFQDINTGTKNVFSNWTGDVINPLNRGLDTAAKMYERNVPGAAGGAAVYRNTQIPINALAAIATLGAGEAGTVGEAGAEAGDAGKLARLRSFVGDILNRPLSGNEDNIISRTGQSVISKARPVAEALNTPIKSTKQGINIVRDLVGNRGVQDAGRGAVDAGEIGNLLTDAQVNDLTTTQIPVSQGVSVNQPPSEGVNIPVTNANTPKPIIQEVSGDAKTATTSAQAAQNAINARRVEAAKNASTGLPDRTIEGVTPGTPNKPFTLNPADIKKNQAKIVQDYADTLRNMGEGNGTQLVPDGNGGYTRTSNNVRTAETAGKKMTKADWRDEAQHQLESGSAEPGHQNAFNDAANPEVQSQLAQGEQAPVEAGRPITVKQSTGIPVTDQTVVPQNLPETPGTVRVTKATAPSIAKSEAVAAQPSALSPKEAPAVPPVDTPAALPENLPSANESDESFLKRQAQDMKDNIQRATDSLKMTKKMTKAQRAEQAAAGEKAFQEAKAAGLSGPEQDAARRTAMRGAFDRVDYQGTPIHSADEQRLRDMVDSHYSDMPFQKANVQEAFSKLFHAGEPGWQSEAGNHIIPSDIKNIRKFLNESVPNADGNGGLGDFAAPAIDNVANEENGPGRLAKAIGLQRAIRFTADISATGRQALAGALSHPGEFAQAAKKSFEVMFSHEKYQQYASELRNSKEANYINDRLGAHLSVLSDPINQQDDIYRNSDWASKIPGVKQVVGASERQYNTILTEMRRLSGQRFIDAAGGIGGLEKAASDSGNPDEFLKAIGTVANVNTGRGLNGEFDSRTAKVLSNVLVSPRGLAARIQRFNPQYYTDLFKANPAAGKEALRSLGIQAAVTASALAAANKAGMYEDGQIKVGNTRYDITGGAANMVRTVVRVAQFMSGDRATTPFNSAEDEVIKWARNQLSPFLATALDTIGIHKDAKTGEYVNRLGEQVTTGNEVLNNLTPVNASQVNQDLQLNTPPGQTAINAGLNTAGIGVNTYQSAADKKAGAAGTSSGSVKSGAVGDTPDMASYKAVAPKEGYDLRQLGDGSYAYSLNGDTHSAKSLKEAQQAVAKDAFDKSGKNYTVIKDTVLRRSADGTISATPKVKFDYQMGTATLTKQKTNDDLQGWLKTANGQLDSIKKQLLDPSIDPLDAITLQNDAQSLVNDMAKYKSYGGFTKPKGFGAAPKALDTSFGALKADSSAPRVQKYDTIDMKSGSIPHIKVERPNIVHKITSGGGI